MKPVTIAQIGIGNAHSVCNYPSLVRQRQYFDVKGFCLTENDEPKYKADRALYDVAPKLTLEAILNDPTIEAVSIEAEEMFGAKYARMAAEAGKHIFMDKPGGTNHAEFAEALRLIQSKGLKLHLGYMYRNNPSYCEALKLIESGAIGQVYAVEAHMNCLHNAVQLKWMNHFKGGQMYFLGCHLVDIIYRVMGEPEAVLPMNACTGIDGETSEDYGMAAFKYPTGYSFATSCGREPGGFMRRQVVITGSKGTIEINPIEHYLPNENAIKNMLSTMRVTYADDPKGWHARGEARVSEPYNRYDGMTADFAREVRGEQVNPYSIDYEIRLHELVMRACGSGDALKL